MTVAAFHRMATSPDTLRFSFVRNPYARAVSCWADKFGSKPLVPGDVYIDAYLALRPRIDADLPVGNDSSLSFADFVTFAAFAAKLRHEIHLQTQDDILRMPGIALDLIGRLESFDADFARVLDHMKAPDEVRHEAATKANASTHDQWPKYYTSKLADAIYRAYECDFDRFGYPRQLPL
jgi:hypothetical protein